MRATFPEEHFSEIPLESRWVSAILLTDQTGEDRKLLHAAREWQQRFQGRPASSGSDRLNMLDNHFRDKDINSLREPG